MARTGLLRANGESSSIALVEKYGFDPLTVEELFARLDDAYATHAEVVDVTYDWTWGYPTDVRVDPSRNAIDDEFEYRVDSFEPTGM